MYPLAVGSIGRTTGLRIYPKEMRSVLKTVALYKVSLNVSDGVQISVFA